LFFAIVFYRTEGDQRDTTKLLLLEKKGM